MAKNILITGAAGNLGRAVVKKLTAEGHQVAGTLEPGHTMPGGKTAYYECNLKDEEATNRLFEELKGRWSSLDAVVMLVGGFAMGSIENASSRDMQDMFTLNYMTAFHTSAAAFKWMKQTGGGKMIFMGAKPAIEHGAAAILPYAISKAALFKLSEVITEDGRGDNIQGSVIVPSIIDTPPNREGMPDADFEDWVTPEQIAEAIAYMLSEAGDPLRHTVLKLYNRV